MFGRHQLGLFPDSSLSSESSPANVAAAVAADITSSCYPLLELLVSHPEPRPSRSSSSSSSPPPSVPSASSTIPQRSSSSLSRCRSSECMSSPSLIALVLALSLLTLAGSGVKASPEAATGEGSMYQTSQGTRELDLSRADSGASESRFCFQPRSQRVKERNKSDGGEKRQHRGDRVGDSQVGGKRRGKRGCQMAPPPFPRGRVAEGEGASRTDQDPRC